MWQGELTTAETWETDRLSALEQWGNHAIGASADGIASLQIYKTQPDWLKAQYIMIAPTQPAEILLPTVPTSRRLLRIGSTV